MNFCFVDPWAGGIAEKLGKADLKDASNEQHSIAWPCLIGAIQKATHMEGDVVANITHEPTSHLVPCGKCDMKVRLTNDEHGLPLIRKPVIGSTLRSTDRFEQVATYGADQTIDLWCTELPNILMSLGKHLLD